MNLAAVICVRMSSSRLPGKALCVYDEATGKTNLECLIERVKTSRHNPSIIIATSTDPSDDPIQDLHSKISTHLNPIYLARGSLENVVQRFNQALHYIPRAEYLWRVMADCPLVDVNLVDWRLDVLERNHLDFLTMTDPEPTYAAQGSVWSREAWDHCAKMSSGSLLEHPGEYLYENQGMFRTAVDIGPENVYYQNIRTELDTPEDLEFFKAVWREAVNFDDDSYPADMTRTKDVLTWLSHRPDIIALNAHIQEKTHSNKLHGHHRARNFRCANPECNRPIAIKVNDALEIKCAHCGTARRFYASPK